MAVRWPPTNLDFFQLVLNIGGKAFGPYFPRTMMNVKSKRPRPLEVYDRDGKPLNEGDNPSEVSLDFSQLAAWLSVLDNSCYASAVEPNANRRPWTHLCQIYCNECVCMKCEKSQPTAAERRAVEPDVGPLFWVYARVDGTDAFFLPLFLKSCRHMESYWKIPVSATGKKYPCMLDCAIGVDRLVHSYRLRHCGLLCPFGAYLFGMRAVRVTETAWFLRYCVPKSTARRWMQSNEDSLSLVSLLQSLPGYKVVRVAPGEPTVREKKRRLVCPVDGVLRPLVSITWIAPWAPEAFNHGNYLELDCSFSVTAPFVYCVPQSIICNEALPLGFVTTPTERQTTYQMFLEDMFAAYPDFKWKIPHIILSDEGTALKAFGKLLVQENKWQHFFCHAHLIRKFGAAGFLGMLISFILGLLTKKAFDELRPQVIAFADILREEASVPVDKYEAFVAFLQGDFAHGLWDRIALGVGRASNHAERFHGVVKAAIMLIRSLVFRLRKLCTYIQQRYDDYVHSWNNPSSPNYRRQLWHTVNNLIRRGHGEQPYCGREHCIEYRRMMAKRYGTRTFPCEHTAAYWKLHNTGDIPKLPEINVSPRAAELKIIEHERLEENSTRASFKEYVESHPLTDLVDDHEENRTTDEALPSTFGNINGYPFARSIVMYVQYLAHHRITGGDVVINSHWILADWIVEYEKMLAEGLTDAKQKQWIARKTLSWCQWAKSGDLNVCPVALPPPPRPLAPVLPSWLNVGAGRICDLRQPAGPPAPGPLDEDPDGSMQSAILHPV